MVAENKNSSLWNLLAGLQKGVLRAPLAVARASNCPHPLLSERGSIDDWNRRKKINYLMEDVVRNTVIVKSLVKPLSEKSSSKTGNVHMHAHVRC